MANIKVFVVQQRCRQHPGDDNDSTFLQTAKLKMKMYSRIPLLRPSKFNPL